MKRVRKGVTLFIVTVVMAMVALSAAVFTLYFSIYSNSINNYSKFDQDKISIRNTSYLAYENFLADKTVNSGYKTGKLRSVLLEELEDNSSLNVEINQYNTKFTKSGTSFSLTVFGRYYDLSSIISCSVGEYSLSFNNYVLKD